MKRIRSAYDTKFRHMLAPLHPRKMEKALAWFSTRAEEMSREKNILLPVALHSIHQNTQRKIKNHLGAKTAPNQNSPDPIFWCDAGLGGLARWLRVAGYEAFWEYGIDDAELLLRADRIKAIVLTTDSGLMERGTLRDGHLLSLWLPPALHIPEQLAAVFAEFNLKRRPSRCTHCGGHLLAIDKELYKEAIPARTFRWLDQFWRCDRCGKLFWNGTHWRKIQHDLEVATNERKMSAGADVVGPSDPH